MTTELLDAEPVDGGAPPADLNGSAPPSLDRREWQEDKAGREYVPKPHGRGMIYRLDGESVDQALARDALPKDGRPRRKPKAPKLPPAPTKPDLRELEKALAEALKSPGMMCAMAGDEWGAGHFVTMGPALARNLIVASEHNPWLRRKLEEAATGQDSMMLIVTMAGVGGALFAYAIPPIVYWFNLPVPEQGRKMFGIPPRKERPAEYSVMADAETAEEPIAA